MLTSRVHWMSVEDVVVGGRTRHVAVCACSWESEPFENRFDAVMVNCAVMEAELEGAQRKRRRRQLAHA